MVLCKELLDIYSDYLLTSFSHTTSIGLSKVLANSISHDKISRLLGGNYQEKQILQHTEYTSKDLWNLLKPTIRQEEFEDAIITLDDTVEEKEYADENEVICYHFDHTKGRNVKGVNIFNFLYLDKKLIIPIAFEIVKKPDIQEKIVLDKKGN